jgi:hypothetical protein
LKGPEYRKPREILSGTVGLQAARYQDATSGDEGGNGADGK